MAGLVPAIHLCAAREDGLAERGKRKSALLIFFATLNWPHPASLGARRPAASREPLTDLQAPRPTAAGPSRAKARKGSRYRLDGQPSDFHRLSRSWSRSCASYLCPLTA